MHVCTCACLFCVHLFTCICMFVYSCTYMFVYLYVCICLSFSPYLKKAYSMNSEGHQNIIAIAMIPFYLFFWSWFPTVWWITGVSICKRSNLETTHGYLLCHVINPRKIVLSKHMLHTELRFEQGEHYYTCTFLTALLPVVCVRLSLPKQYCTLCRSS